jgi:hypothetical protein
MQYSYNYLSGHKMSMADLFIDSSPYLFLLEKFCRNVLLGKNLPDATLLKKGSKPDLKNYNTWYFTDSGIAIIFNTSQVAPYYLGAQIIKVPKAKIIEYIKKDVSKAIWG